MKTSTDSLTAEDCEQVEAHGLTVEQIEVQLERFRKGFPPIELDRPCTIGDGILQIPAAEHEKLITLHDEAAATGRMMKFVPASGAASRMFRELLSYYRADPPPDELTPELIRFFTLIHSFAFYDALKATMADHGQDIEALLAAQDYPQILKFLLTADGLDYAHTPKAMIPFHGGDGTTRTALAEHLMEATATIQDGRHVCRLHFTVAPQHALSIKTEAARIGLELQRTGVHFEITYSTQASGTDTIAVDLGNQPFRDEQQKLIFRPGGHGALLQNLNALDGDIVFIKNIDNVTPSSRLEEQTLYKKLLGGVLVQTQRRVFELVRELSAETVDDDARTEATRFVKEGLGISLPQGTHVKDGPAHAQTLLEILQRPLRVCGVVQNVGEPGGGPFWVKDTSGRVSHQLVEAVQVQRADPEQQRLLTEATHFNPVDLVCGIRDHQGHPFDLTQYTDPETGIITGKSYHGRELKALEWPGLWNGGMAKWITLFVEVPLSTFAPVKTVNDLLRPEHQNP